MGRYSDRFDGGGPAYVSVGERQAAAERKLKALQKKGQNLQPVVLEGSTIARTFWGKAWCKNLEAYSDFANRLPRGRSYVRSQAVIDLKIEQGRVAGQVMGSSLYRVDVTLEPLRPKVWADLLRECAGKIDSLIGLLQGKLSKAVMEVLTRPGEGMFPSPKELKLSCSCPDGARMCKHVAAVLYGVGARLDEKPELFFVLRQVNQLDLIGQAAAIPALEATGSASSARRLTDDSLSSLFGIDLPDEEEEGGVLPVGPPTLSGGDAERGSSRQAKPKPTTSPARSQPTAKAEKAAPTPKVGAAGVSSAGVGKGKATRGSAAASSAPEPATPAPVTPTAAPPTAAPPTAAPPTAAPTAPPQPTSQFTAEATAARLAPKRGARVTARELTAAGIPHAVLQRWLLSGGLSHSGERGNYLITSLTRERIVQFLAGKQKD